jgi:hypothetical protein
LCERHLLLQASLLLVLCSRLLLVLLCYEHLLLQQLGLLLGVQGLQQLLAHALGGLLLLLLRHPCHPHARQHA